LAGGCGKGQSRLAGLEESGRANLDKDTSYAFGMFLGAQFRDFQNAYSLDVPLDYEEFFQGFRAFVEGNEPRMTLEEVEEKVNTAIIASLKKKNLEEEKAFLEENARKPGIQVTPSGLQYEVLSEGTGAKPGAEDRVQVNYEGKLLNGTIFDSSYTRGQPAEFSLKGVIPGWTEGLQLMPEGSTYRFFIPSSLAYGPEGAGNSVPPNSLLIFKVDLLSVLKEDK